MPAIAFTNGSVRDQLMTKEEIQKYLRALNDELQRIDVKGEVCLC